MPHALLLKRMQISIKFLNYIQAKKFLHFWPFMYSPLPYPVSAFTICRLQFFRTFADQFKYQQE
jgi:hypothetical protein